jgi:CheY-like chemotaxis protein
MSTPNRVPHPLAVLVVDDSADTVDSLAELLSLYGHRVCVAFDGEQALQRVGVEVPDVVLLDIRMPGLDGCEVAKLIRARGTSAGKQPLLIAITGCGTDDDRFRTSAAGFDLHMVKPVDPAVLVGVMERFRRLLAPTTPAAEIEPHAEDPPDDAFNTNSFRHAICLKQTDEFLQRKRPRPSTN